MSININNINIDNILQMTLYVMISKIFYNVFLLKRLIIFFLSEFLQIENNLLYLKNFISIKR